MKFNEKQSLHFLYHTFCTIARRTIARSVTMSEMESLIQYHVITVSQSIDLDLKRRYINHNSTSDRLQCLLPYLDFMWLLIPHVSCAI